MDLMPETNKRGFVFKASLLKQYKKETILNFFTSESAVHN
jgi:hypothetical protein